ncbi:MAG TPA: polysaccharide deacetylase family protein [Kofleriaceae bacterium]|nr:polysaccharide deacetylase family protein [Kofleriaceae bacterium]
MQRGLAIAVVCAGCTAGAPAWPDDPAIFYPGGDAPRVVCASDIDARYAITLDDIDRAVARAADEQSTLHLYTHDPGVTVAPATIEHLLATAAAHGLSFVTYDALGTAGHGGLALGFDDDSVADWTALRPVLDRYGARVTFFVSGFAALTADERGQLHALAADGHAIEYHSVSHQNAVDYVAAHGLAAYLADEITPGLAAMRGDGFAATAFAYPYGARDEALDAALAPMFEHLRAIRSTCPR